MFWGDFEWFFTQFCFFPNPPQEWSFKSSSFVACIKPSQPSALTLALSLTLKLSPTLTLNPPLTQTIQLYRFWPGPHPYLANRVQFWGQKWQNLAGSLTTPGPNWAYGPWNEYFGDNLWELWLLLLAATGPERALLALNEHILLNFDWSSIYCHLNISRLCFLLSSERQVISFDQFCSVSFCLSVFVY